MRLLERFEKKPINTEIGILSHEQLIFNEQERLHNILGARVEAIPLPEYVTYRTQKKLAEIGYKKIIYMPGFPDLNSEQYIKSEGVVNFLNDYTRAFPELKPLQKLNNGKKPNEWEGWYLEHWYWRYVGKGNIIHRHSKGHWLAIETIDKPEYGQKYSNTPVEEMLELHGDRFKDSRHTILNGISKNKQVVLDEIGLLGKPVDLRMPEADEWTMAAESEGWGKTNTSELTNTVFRLGNESHGVIVGRSDYGGNGYARWALSNYNAGGVGWRTAIVFGY